MGANRRFAAALLVPAVAFLLVFMVVPLCLLFFISFQNQTQAMQPAPGFTAARYVEVLAGGQYLPELGITLGIAALTTAIVLVLAYPAANLIATARSKGLRSLLYVLLVSPLLTSVVVRTFAWIVLLSQNGLINQVLQEIGAISQPLPFLWNMGAVVLAYVQVLLPFAVMPILTSMGEIDPNVSRASASLGAGRVRTFFTVKLPLTIPGAVNGGVIVFTLAAGSYITPLLVGGGMQPLLPLAIYQQAVQVSDLRMAAAMAVVLLVAVFIIILPVEMLLRRWEAKVNG